MTEAQLIAFFREQQKLQSSLENIKYDTVKPAATTNAISKLATRASLSAFNELVPQQQELATKIVSDLCSGIDSKNNIKQYQLQYQVQQSHLANIVRNQGQMCEDLLPQLPDDLSIAPLSMAATTSNASIDDVDVVDMTFLDDLLAQNSPLMFDGDTRTTQTQSKQAPLFFNAQPRKEATPTKRTAMVAEAAEEEGDDEDDVTPVKRTKKQQAADSSRKYRAQRIQKEAESAQIIETLTLRVQELENDKTFLQRQVLQLQQDLLLRSQPDHQGNFRL